jgi:hypothetical protein
MCDDELESEKEVNGRTDVINQPNGNITVRHFVSCN